MVLPGLALHRAVTHHPKPFEAMASALVVSPILVASVAALVMSLGGSALQTAFTLTALVAMLCAVVASKPTNFVAIDRRHVVHVAFAALSLAFLTGFLPMTEEWWRIRSDAWFHLAVVEQLSTYGVPPEDPYFLGFPLQYMWYYHVLVATVMQITHLPPEWVMALINIQVVAGLVVAVYCWAGVYQARHSKRLASALMVPLGFNGLFYAFLPVKVARGLVGEVRGWHAVQEQFNLDPFNYSNVSQLLTIHYNADFLLDKYMVATAFSVGLACLALGWYAACEFMSSRRVPALVVLFFSLVGMIGFHSVVGFVMLVGIFAGVGLTWLLRVSNGFSTSSMIAILGTALAAFLAMLPYVYSLMHAKESDHVVPVSFSLNKTIGFAISCALVVVLAWFQRKRLNRNNPAHQFLLFGWIAVAVFCLGIHLPGPNTYDKLGLFVYFPIALVAGWTMIDWAERFRHPTRSAWLLGALFFLPVNGLAFAGAFNTPGEVIVTDAEKRVAEWVRSNTSRDAVFIDDHDIIFLLVEGPRRYLWGRRAYADQWGYDSLEVARRYHTRNTLFNAEPMDATTLEVLGDVEQPLYIIFRKGDYPTPVNAERFPQLFKRVHSTGEIDVFQVDTAACARTAESGAFAFVPKEELLRESDL